MKDKRGGGEGGVEVKRVKRWSQGYVEGEGLREKLSHASLTSTGRRIGTPCICANDANTHTHTHTLVHTYIYRHTHIHIHIRTHTHTHKHIHIHIHTHTNIPHSSLHPKVWELITHFKQTNPQALAALNEGWDGGLRAVPGIQHCRDAGNVTTEESWLAGEVVF